MRHTLRVITVRILFGLILAALSASANAGLLYAVQSGSDTLISIDTDTLATSTIGSLGVGFSFGGLAYDGNSDTLYMIGGRNNDNLFTVDRSTGQATLVGDHGIDDLFGLAYDSKSNSLYGTQFSGGSGLYSLDTNTGGATAIDFAMQNHIGGLAYDSKRDMLVGIQDGAGDLYAIDKTDGSQTLLFDGDFVNDSGLAYDKDKDLLWDLDYNGNLKSYDPNSDYSDTTVLTGLVGPHDGLAYVATVPVPAAVWLFGSALAGLGWFRRKTA
jgi:hypothetical protein